MMHAFKNSLVITITGGIASGKSEVGRILKSLGFELCDADHLAHELMRKGMKIYQGVVSSFGEGILSTDGEIDRQALGKIVFSDPQRRAELNQLVHPAVRETIVDWMARMRQANQKAAALVPLLYESGMENLGWDAVVCVAAPRDQVIDRLRDRGFDGAEAEQRIAAQMPAEERQARAEFVIWNDRSLADLEQNVRKTVELIISE